MIIRIAEVKDHLSATVTIRGWITHVRSSGKIIFLEVRDGSGFIQAIIEESSVSGEIWGAAQRITIESSVIVEGMVAAHPRHPNTFELRISGFTVVQVAGEYPIGQKEHGPDFLLDHRHLWIRAPRQEAILRIRDGVVRALMECMHSHGFVLTHTPTFTPNACEGTTDLFEVQYFDRTAYLTQNGQLYLEALAMALGKVYDLNPNFRAEKSKTRKHLTEFWTLNPEAAFMTHPESMALQEKVVSFVVRTILETYSSELDTLERDREPLKRAAEGAYPRLTYGEAVGVAQKAGSTMQYGDDFGAEEEALITASYDRPIFIERWPRVIKPFYAKRDPEDPSLVLCSDMMAPEGYGEIIGGSQREDDFETLKSSILEHKLPLSVFEWYLDLRRYGSVPHSGFGIGIERLVAWISGTRHVRETTAFPRMLNRIEP